MRNITDLAIQEAGYVEGILIDGLLKERLLSLGLTKGTKLIPIRKGPRNNLTLYLIRGVMIALRKEEAMLILIKEDDLIGAY